jgi:hypothetical protein
MTAEQNPPRVISDRYDSLAAVLDKIGLTRTHKLIILLVAFGALFDAIEQFNIGYAGPVLQKLWGCREPKSGSCPPRRSEASRSGA